MIRHFSVTARNLASTEKLNLVIGVCQKVLVLDD